MSSAVTVTSAIAIAACVLGGGVALGMWRQRAAAARARRLRHPSTPPPVAVAVDAEGAARRWRIDVAADAPPTAIDIVSWRVRDASQPWRSEAIVAPIEISPGGWALMPGEIPVAGAYDVVVAWTNHTAAGELEGSRTFRVDGRPVPRTGTPPQRVGRPPLRWPLVEALMVLALVGAGIIVVLAWIADDSPAGTALPTPSDAPATATTVVPTTTATTVVPPPTTASAVPTTTPLGAAPTITPEATAVPTTRPVVTFPPTTAPSSAPSSAPGTAPSTSPTTSAPAAGDPRVDVAATIDQCSAGPNCLVASFTIDGFDSPQSEYVCEFADGERLTFGFGGTSVARACATGSADASITIEVGGVRSATVTRDDA